MDSVVREISTVPQEKIAKVHTARSLVKAALRRIGYAVIGKETASRSEAQRDPFIDIDDATKELFQYVQPFTLTGLERVAALRQAVQYVVESGIPGDIVECGVWKGGSMMAVAKTLQFLASTERKLYLFDTFEGMTAPSAVDKDFSGEDASRLLADAIDVKEDASIWAISSLDAVKRAMTDTGYDPEKIVYVAGRVEDTIPAKAPDKIALLRLDTDWYESTYHELVHLFPRLAVGGVLIIDDYGHWQGARRAVDQYLKENKIRVLLNRIDYTGRIAVKLEN